MSTTKQITQYKQSQHKTALGQTAFTVNNLTPVFDNQEEQKKARCKVEAGLYSVFKKYVP